MSLRDALNKRMDEGDLGGYVRRGTRSSGIDVFDYMNGFYGQNKKLVTGMSEGKIIYFAGASGSGKSSAAIETGTSIISEIVNDNRVILDDGMMIVFDCEKSNTHVRISQLMGIPYSEYAEKYEETAIKLINSGTSTDNLQALIRSIYEVKMSEYAGVTFTKKGASDKTKWKDVRERIESMPPTVIIVDSLATLSSTKADEDGEMRGNMAAAQIAKMNNQMVKQLSGTGWLYDANIILIFVNHITKTVSTEMYPPDSRPVKWMKPNETLPGGGTAAYMADFMIRLDQGKALDPNEEFQVKGFICNAILCKSRSNASGHAMSLVFDQHRGIDNVLTNYLILKNNGLIGGAGRGYFLNGLPDVKFQQSTIRDLYSSNKTFRKHFDKLVHQELSKFIKAIAGKNSDSEDSKFEEDADYTEDDVKKMSLAELKILAEKFEVEVYKGFWKQDIKKIRKELIESMFSDDEDEDD